MFEREIKTSEKRKREIGKLKGEEMIKGCTERTSGQERKGRKEQ